MHSTRCLVTVSFAPTTEPTGLPAYIVHVEPASAADLKPRGFTEQLAAEHYADGVAAGLRACGRTVEISIDVPEEPTVSEDDADLLDFASFDVWADERAKARTAGPEVDAVSARLARDAEAGHYRAAALGI